MNNGNTSLSSFWKNFVAEHWQQKPLLLKKNDFVSLANETEVFQGLIEASRRFREDKIKLPFELFNETGKGFEDSQLEVCLPDNSDENIFRYAERITNKLNGQKFALILNGLFFAHQPKLWLKTRSFLCDFLRLVPNQTWCSAVFVGNYDTTPFGVHQDDKSTFQYVIAGRKRMRLWSNEFVEQHPELRWSHNYEKFLDDAITLEAEAGDLMFWNQSYWHIGESGEGLSMGLSIGFREIEKSKAKTEIEQKVESLIQQTSARTNDFPPPASWQKLSDKDVIYADARFPIEWIFTQSFRAIISANGHAFPFLADERVISLLSLLNTGEALRVEDLLSEFSGAADYDGIEFEIKPEGLRDLLERFLSLRAIERCETGSENEQTFNGNAIIAITQNQTVNTINL